MFESFWLPRPSNFEAKLFQNWSWRLSGGFLEGSWGHLGPKRAPRANKTSKTRSLDPPGPPKLEPCWGVLGLCWGYVGRFWWQVGGPNPKPTCIMVSTAFLIDFGGLLARFCDGFGPQVEGQVDQKIDHMASRWQVGRNSKNTK